MPPIVIDIRNAEDARDVVHRAVQALAEGHLVAIPTETVYGLAASACRADAVQKLLTGKGPPDRPADGARDQKCRRSPRFRARYVAARSPPGPPLLAGSGDARSR